MEGPDLLGSAKGLPVPNNTNLVSVFWAFEKAQVPINSIAINEHFFIGAIINYLKNRYLNIARICELP
jgi:hypothetical protein